VRQLFYFEIIVIVLLSLFIVTAKQVTIQTVIINIRFSGNNFLDLHHLCGIYVHC